MGIPGQTRYRTSPMKPSVKWLSTGSSDASTAKPSCSDSFRDLCTSKSDLKLSWGDVRLTVEMKIGTSRSETTGRLLTWIWELLENHHRAFRSSATSSPRLPRSSPRSHVSARVRRVSVAYSPRQMATGARRLAGKRSRATVENVPMSANPKPKLAAVFGDGD